MQRLLPLAGSYRSINAIQYALDKPGVLRVLPGIRNVEDVKHLLGFFDAAEEERDYSALGSYAPTEMAGTCVYCNHCQPCPAGLNVGLMNKYYDLAKAGDTMAADHYPNMELHADSCIQCGHCESRFPFHVKQMARMEEINSFFNR